MKKLILISLLSLCTSAFAAEDTSDNFYENILKNITAKEIVANRNFKLSQCRVLSERGALEADDSYNDLTLRLSVLANNPILEIYSQDRLALSYLVEKQNKTIVSNGANLTLKLATDNTMVILAEGLIFCKTQ